MVGALGVPRLFVGKMHKLVGGNSQALFPVAKSWERVSFWAFWRGEHGMGGLLDVGERYGKGKNGRMDG